MYNFRFREKTYSFDCIMMVVVWCFETCVRMRFPKALLRRGSLVGVCYSSLGSRLSVWCLTLRRLAILSGGRCCAVSCISGLTCSLIVKCNFVYV
jgi:hypothetical protein